MEITFLKVHKPAVDVRPLVDVYLKRLSAFTKVQLLELKDEEPSALLERFKKILKPGHKLVLLDERGKTFTTENFSAQLKVWIEDPGVKGLVFAVGGPFGFDESIRKQGGFLLALSPLTFQGDLAWLILTEQVYRAFTILKNIDYHH